MPFSGQPRRNPWKPYQPALGAALERDEVPAIEARTRGFLARLIALVSTAAVAVAGGYGLATGRYAAIEVVRAVAGPIVGAVTSHYFGPRRGDLA